MSFQSTSERRSKPRANQQAEARGNSRTGRTTRTPAFSSPDLLGTGQTRTQEFASFFDLARLPAPDLSADQHGSLVTREPERWLVCFVPAIQEQWWHLLLFSWMKHCFMMRREESVWLLFEPWWSRVMLTTHSDAEAACFLTWATRGAVLEVTENIPRQSLQLRGWMSCASLLAHVLGRRYWVWTPSQLWRKLQSEGTNRHDSRSELAYLGAHREPTIPPLASVQ